jgi:hypothetical protein
MRRPSPGVVIATIALFVAMFGTAYAASKINGKNLKNGSVPGNKLKNGAVGTKQLKNAGVTAAKLSDGAVTGAKLAPGAVTGDKLSDGSVTAAKLAPGAVAVDTLPKVYLHFDSAGTFIPGESRGVVSINQPVANVACLDLASPAITGGATRGLGAGAPPIVTPQIGIPPAPLALGCPASHSDAVVQLAGASAVKEIYAWFDF